MSFLKVLPDFFKEGKQYSFRIFLYNNEREIRTTSALEHTPVTKEVIGSWHDFIGKGACLEIHEADVDVLFIETSADENELRQVNLNHFECIDIYEKRFQEYSSLSQVEIDLKKCIQKISKDKNFTPLIEQVRAEVLCFELYLSESVSLCTALVEKLFKKDSGPVRVACLSYFLAKVNGIEDPCKLSDIIVSALLRDVGHVMLKRSLFENEQINSNSMYLKHPMLSIYILSKTGVDFNKDIKRHILEHHEQSDGSGFPRQKKERQTLTASYIINMSQQIIEFCSKPLTEEDSPRVDRLTFILWGMRKQTDLKGYNTKFPQDLSDSVLKLIKLEN